MRHTRRFSGTLALFALASTFAVGAHAGTTTYNGKLAGDDSVFTVNISAATAQTYSFSTTSFASGGFVPVLTLFSANGGNPIAFAETDNSDVLINQLLGPGSYILALTEDPNVFTTTFAAGTLFAGDPTITGDLCGVSGGKFLNVFNGCTQQTSNYSVTVSSTAVTPEPSTWLLVMPAVALLFAERHRRRTV